MLCAQIGSVMEETRDDLSHVEQIFLSSLEQEIRYTIQYVPLHRQNWYERSDIGSPVKPASSIPFQEANVLEWFIQATG